MYFWFTGSLPLFPAVKIVKASKATRHFFRKDFFVCFASSLLKYKKFFKLEPWKFHFLNYMKFFQSGFFCFLSMESSFLKFFNPGAKKFHFLKYEEFCWCRFFLFFQDWPESRSGSPIVHYHECQTFSKNKHKNRPQITQYISKTSLSLFGEFQIVGPLLVKRKDFLF